MQRKNTDGLDQLVSEMDNATLHNTSSPASVKPASLAPTAPKKPNTGFFNDPVVRKLKLEFDNVYVPSLLAKG